jgi:transposase
MAVSIHGVVTWSISTTNVTSERFALFVTKYVHVALGKSGGLSFPKNKYLTEFFSVMTKTEIIIRMIQLNIKNKKIMKLFFLQGYYLMMDNLSVHRGPSVLEAAKNTGNIILYRPPYSPELGPIECCFSKIKLFLRQHKYEITEENLMHYVFAGIKSITAKDCQSWFSHCGYNV